MSLRGGLLWALVACSLDSCPHPPAPSLCPGHASALGFGAWAPCQASVEAVMSLKDQLGLEQQVGGWVLCSPPAVLLGKPPHLLELQLVQL